MDPLNLSHLSGLLEKATKGPWSWTPGANNIDTGEGQKHPIGQMDFIADLKFVAAIRNAAPDLIRLARERERYAEALECIARQFGDSSASEHPQYKLGLQVASEAAQNVLSPTPPA